MYSESKYQRIWKLNYVPSYYEGISEEQQRDNKIVIDFKNGIYDEDVVIWFRRRIWNITRKDEPAWTVCFMPCSNDKEQQKRFGKLAEYLKKTTRENICLSAFGFVENRKPSHSSGQTKIDVMDIGINIPDISKISNNKVIIIDDVLTSGKTFERTADQAMLTGARTVVGLFLAKTKHPNLPKKTKQMSKKDIEDALIQEEAEIMNKLSSFPSEDEKILIK